MAYTARTWIGKNTDGTVPSGAMPISAENLNIMEKGIEEAVNRIQIGEFSLEGKSDLSNGKSILYLDCEPKYFTATSHSGKSSFSLFRVPDADGNVMATDHNFVRFESGCFCFEGMDDITNDELMKYFDVSNGNPYYFVYDKNTGIYTSNNKGFKDSEAKTTLTAKFDIEIEVTYGYSSESADKLYVTIQEGDFIIKTINSSGGAATEKTYKGIIKKGHSVVFRYKKDSSVSSGSDQCYFKNIKAGIENGNWSYMAIK